MFKLLEHYRVIFFVAMILHALGTTAQEIMKILQIDGEIELDGNVDEPVWELIDPLPMVMHRPVKLCLKVWHPGNHFILRHT